MAEPDKQQIGDGNDNFADAARKSAEAAKQISQAAAQKAAATGATATANAAAATVEASVSTGKAVAEIAAGTAAGGPWGAILSAAWSMRHTLFKVLICSCLALLIIIILIVSLPSIVFHRPEDPSVPAELFAVYEEMSAIVSDCVMAGYDYAMAEVKRIIAEGGYDYQLSIDTLIDFGHESLDFDVCYILAAYSASLEQKGTNKQDMKNKLDAVVTQMFQVTYEAKETTVVIPPENEGDEAVIETVRYVICTIHQFDREAIITAFEIDLEAPYGQFGIKTGDAILHMATALKCTIYGSLVSYAVPPITDAELNAFISRLTCSPARKSLIRTGLSLVGRVPYFWGGKSPAGWNPEWNTPKLVTATGSSSTGTIRPFGLDCSGFTDWTYKTGLGVGLKAGSESQWYDSTPITAEELLPGDLGFLDKPGAVSINHVMIYAGTDEKGKRLWVHSSSDNGGVALNSPNYVKYFRRVNGIDLDSAAVPAAGDPL